VRPATQERVAAHPQGAVTRTAEAGGAVMFKLLVVYPSDKTKTYWKQEEIG